MDGIGPPLRTGLPPIMCTYTHILISPKFLFALGQGARWARIGAGQVFPRVSELTAWSSLSLGPSRPGLNLN